jgi:hypothetical protein
MDPTPFDRLVDGYLRGTLNEGQAAELLALLQARPDLGHELLDQWQMDALLKESAAGGGVPVPASAGAAASGGPWRIWAVCGILLAAGLGGWAAFRFGFGPGTGRSVPRAEATTRAVALLARSADARWVQNSPHFQAGSTLGPGWVRLESGLVQIEFFSGARLVLEGPAELQVISSSEAYCAAGRVFVEVPPQARGFRVGTAEGALVHSATSYGVHVNGDGCEIHVFRGEVQFEPATGQGRRLGMGSAVALSKHTLSPIALAAASSFHNPDDLALRSSSQLYARLEKWRAAGRRWNQDPSLLIRFDFETEDASEGTFNRAVASGLGTGGSAGAVVGGGRTEGRWGGKPAFHFRNVADRIRVEVPEECASLTLAAWIRVDGLERAFSGLFMSEKWGRGGVHWQILRDGRVRLGLASYDSISARDYDSQVVFAQERLGQWVHLAVVIDSVSGQVLHYLNGVENRRSPFLIHPLRVGIADLGNWNVRATDNTMAIRNLSGAMDEFACYTRALRAEEIFEIWDRGRP